MFSSRAHALLLRPSILMLCFLVSLPGAARQPTREEAEILERVRELRREIEELLDLLPPELRAAASSDRAAESPPGLAPSGEATPLPEPVAPPASAPLPEPATAPPPVPSTAAPPTPAPAPPAPVSPQRRRCDALAVFDSNQDGVLDARDRYWRYLDLWIDRDGDGQIGEREVVSTYEQKIEEIAADLDRFESRRVAYGQIRSSDRIVLDLRGDGFNSRDDGVLVVDADALRRGDGPSLQDAAGAELRGTTPLARDQKIVDSAGRAWILGCR